MPEENEEIKVEKKSSSLAKIILFGIPAFIVQLILVYFVTANILMTKVGTTAVNSGSAETEQSEEAESDEGTSSGGKFIYATDEIIVNPANTSGRQFLLTALAFDVASEDDIKELESREFLVKDKVISVLSGKTVRFLSDVTMRDSLRSEIAYTIEGFLPNVNINKIYFSKFIVQ